jgi:hypothetical protein
MRGKQFPPRGPRSNHIKIDVTTEERKEWEAVAKSMGCTVVEAAKTAMRIQARRIADHTPAVTREATEQEKLDEIGCNIFEKMMSEVPGVTVTRLSRRHG